MLQYEIVDALRAINITIGLAALLQNHIHVLACTRINYASLQKRASLYRTIELRPVLQPGPFQIPLISDRCVHLAKVAKGVVQSIGSGRIQTLLGLHGTLHDSMVALEGLHVFLVRLENVLLDALAEAVFTHQLDNLVGVLLLGVNPSDHLIEGGCVGGMGSMEFIGLEHGLADGIGGFFELGHHGGIVKDTARDHAVPSTETKDKVQGRLLLYIVICQGSAIFKLLTSKDQTLLVWRNAFLILDLTFYVLDGVASLDVEGDGLASKSLDENLQGKVVHRCVSYRCTNGR